MCTSETKLQYVQSACQDIADGAGVALIKWLGPGAERYFCHVSKL